MSLDFTKVTYVDCETVISADNLNDIQDAILDLDDKVDDAYVVPESGIPKSTLSQSVQESLEKADEVPNLKSAIKNSGYFSIDFDDQAIETVDLKITNDNTLAAGLSKQIAVSDLKYIYIKANSRGAAFTFLTDSIIGMSAGDSVTDILAQGGGHQSIAGNNDALIAIPDDCAFIVFTARNSENRDVLPSTLIFSEKPFTDILNTVGTITAKQTLENWGLYDVKSSAGSVDVVGTIRTSNGTFTTYSSYKSVQIPVSGLTGIYIKANASNDSYVSLLRTGAEELSTDDMADFATGETLPRIIPAGTDLAITVPDDCHFIFYTRVQTTTNRTPQRIDGIGAPMQNLTAIEPAEPPKYNKLAALGHSITYGMRLANIKDAWPYVTADILGIPSVVNLAVGGSTIAKEEGSYEEIFFSLEEFEEAEKDTSKRYLVKDAPTNAHPFMLYQFADEAWAPAYSDHNAVHGARSPVVDVAQSLPSDADIIVVGAGFNDYQYGWTPFGTVDGTPTKYTFCGAVHTLLQYIGEHFPGVPVIFCDANIWEQSVYTTANSIGKTYLDYLSAMKEIARFYKVPFFDFDAASDIPFASVDPTWYASDEKHPSKKAHERIGQVMAEKIKAMANDTFPPMSAYRTAAAQDVIDQAQSEGISALNQYIKNVANLEYVIVTE